MFLQVRIMYRGSKGANASEVVRGFRTRNVDGYNLKSMSKIISSENGGKTAKNDPCGPVKELLHAAERTI